MSSEAELNAAMDLKRRLLRLDDREIIIETRIITQNLCMKLDSLERAGKERDKKLTALSEKIVELEKHDLIDDTLKKGQKDSGALTVALLALLISGISTLTAVYLAIKGG